MEHPEYIQVYRSKRHHYKLFAAFIAAVVVTVALSLSARAEEMEVVDNPYQTLNITDAEYEELRWVVALESGSNFDDKKAVVEAVFNRCLSQKHDWGGSVHGVLSKRGQFSTYRYIGSKKAWAVPGEAEDDAISEVLRTGVSVLPDYSYVYFDSKGGKNGKRHVKIKGGNTYGAE